MFVVSQVLHDWPDSYCIRILRHLRGAAAPYTQLMIIDNLMSYSCVEEELKTVPGAEHTLSTRPPPLLPNGGHASIFAYLEDLHVRAPPCIVDERS